MAAHQVAGRATLTAGQLISDSELRCASSLCPTQMTAETMATRLSLSFLLLSAMAEGLYRTDGDGIQDHLQASTYSLHRGRTQDGGHTAVPAGPTLDNSSAPHQSSGNSSFRYFGKYDNEAVEHMFPQGAGVSYTNQGCRLRSKRFVSDGLCTSPRPIGEVVCAESCAVPSNPAVSRTLGAYSSKKRNVTKWRCVDGSTRRKRVKLLCRDGTIRSYSLRLVTGCKCSPHSSRHTRN